MTASGDRDEDEPAVGPVEDRVASTPQPRASPPTASSTRPPHAEPAGRRGRRSTWASSAGRDARRPGRGPAGRTRPDQAEHRGEQQAAGEHRDHRGRRPPAARRRRQQARRGATTAEHGQDQPDQREHQPGTAGRRRRRGRRRPATGRAQRHARGRPTGRAHTARPGEPPQGLGAGLQGRRPRPMPAGHAVEALEQRRARGRRTGRVGARGRDVRRDRGTSASLRSIDGVVDADRGRRRRPPIGSELDVQWHVRRLGRRLGRVDDRVRVAAAPVRRRWRCGRTSLLCPAIASPPRRSPPSPSPHDRGRGRAAYGSVGGFPSSRSRSWRAQRIRRFSRLGRARVARRARRPPTRRARPEGLRVAPSRRRRRRLRPPSPPPRPRRRGPAWLASSPITASAGPSDSAAPGPPSCRPPSAPPMPSSALVSSAGTIQILFDAPAAICGQRLQVLVGHHLRVRVRRVDRAEDRADRLGLTLGGEDPGLPVTVGPQHRGLLLALGGEDLRLLLALGVEDRRRAGPARPASASPSSRGCSAAARSP